MMGNRTLFVAGFLCLLHCISAVEVERNDAVCAVHRERQECGWHYLAYFPRMFRSGVTENIILSTHGYPKPVNVTINLIDPARKKLPAVSSTSFIVQPETLSTLPVYVGHNAPSSFNVEIIGKGESLDDGKIWLFTNKSSSIYVQKLGLSIFIQTDRPIYKPGQKIRCRVIVVDTQLKPYEGKLDSVVIENPLGSHMRLWKDIKLEDGLAAFELKTSEKPVMGNWKIKVNMKSYKEELQIVLKKYVLPKFQVTIKPPSFISVTTKQINVEICAKYSYGKSVYGKLNAVICKKRRRYYYRDTHDPKSCFTFSRKIDGCTTVSMNHDKFVDLDTKDKYRYYWSSKFFTMDASVKELASGITFNATTVKKTIEKKEVKLKLKSRDVFKPGFPLDVKLFATYPDGQPIKEIKITVKAGSSYHSNDLMTKNITVRNGEAKINLPAIPFNTRNLNIRASYMRAKIRPNEYNYERESYSSLNLKPWYSPSHSYLYIEKPKAAVKNGTSAEINVKYTSVDGLEVERTVYYSLMCAGNVATSGTVKRTFIAAVPTNPTTHPQTTTAIPTTTTTISTPKQDGTSGGNFSVSEAVTKPPIMIETYPWFQREMATRPPLPYQFSTGQFKFSFEVTANMFPSCRAVVYYMRGEEVVADDTEIDVEDEFENKVSMEFDKSEVRPGNKVKLIVKGYPKSRIAIAAVDKSIHFLAQGNDIKPKQLFDVRERLNIGPGSVRDWGRCRYYRKRRSIVHRYGGGNYVDSEKAFANSGLTVLSSLNIDVRPCGSPPVIAMSLASVDDVDGGSGPSPDLKTTNIKRKGKGNTGNAVRVRTEFPETWLWTEEVLSENGTHVFDVTIPDTITNWYASGFGISKHAGLGVAKPVEIRAFQPFFISLNLPYSVIRGEEVTVPAAVFSYLDHGCVTVRVTLAYSTDYSMIAGPSAKTCLCGGRTATVLFRLRPKKLGRIPIRISAETVSDNACSSSKTLSDVSAADVLVKKLLVEAEGVKQDYTRSSFFCPSDSTSGVYHTDFDLQLPNNVVPGSVFSKVTAMGDLMGSSLSNIDELLAMPYGCGEQNMLKFAPNIFIMNYLKNTNQVTDEIQTKALDYMRSGYQRELNYKHLDGSYSAFGERDNEGSTWLTAFVLKSYAQARPWIDIDPKELKSPVSWLLKSQTKDGCFPTIGDLHNKAMKGGVKTPATLTAYVLISLMEADIKIENNHVIRGASCVLNALDNITDSYSLAIISYLFAKMKDVENYEDTMERLEKLAVDEDGMKYWEEPDQDTKDNKYSWWYKPRSTDIEQTAYALLAKLEFGGKKAVQDTIPIIRWLSKQRSGLGGWSSTQDTVLAMQSLAEFASHTYGEANDVDITVRASPDFKETFKVTKDNGLVVQRAEGVPVPSTLKVSATGKGCAIVQASVLYNIMEVKDKPSFEVTSYITSIEQPLKPRESCRPQVLRVCARWLGEGESNMALIDVQMISGFEAIAYSLDLRNDPVRGLKDIEVKDKSVVYYFNRLDNAFRCVNLQVEQTSNVQKTKPAPIKAYDYYDTGKAATIMYQFTKQQCTGKKA